MRNEWSTIRLDKKVPGTMNGRKIAFGIPILHKDNMINKNTIK